MKKSIFIFVVNYKEGTFISKVIADDIEYSINKWVNNELLEIINLTKSTNLEYKEIKSKIFKNPPIELVNVEDVWCCDIAHLKSKNYVSITVIKKVDKI